MIRLITSGAFLINFAACFTVTERQSPEVCDSPACYEAASSILRSMDQSADPCDNFYQFTCGNFTKNAIIPEDRSATVYYAHIDDVVQTRLRDSIENEIPEDLEAFESLRAYYKLCMDEEQIEKISENEFLGVLKNLGGWPILEGSSWNESSFDWMEATYKLRDTGFPFNSLINFLVSNDMKNNTRKLIHLDEPKFGIDKKYLFKGWNNEIVQAYYKYMVNIAVLFGADREQAKKELKDSLEFEMNLVKITPNYKVYSIFTVKRLEKGLPSIPWLEYINRGLSPYAKINHDSQVIILAPSYLDNLVELLENTPKRTIANYIYWRVVKLSSGMLTKRVREIQREFTASMFGRSKPSPRWHVCVDHLNDRMFLATGSLYIRMYFDTAAKEKAKEMIRTIRDMFESMLREVDWMDDKTRSAAVEKLRGMVSLVAYPDELLDDKKLDDYYKSLKIYPDSFLMTMLSFNQFSLGRKIEELNKPVNKTGWGNHGGAAVVNAYYRLSENSIQFPAGILQGLYFSREHPKYMNYAGMGTFVGHEITHGFDASGRRFDKDGNWFDWWDKETSTEYMNRVQCIIDQYNNYKVEEVGLHVDGVNGRDENIADNGGIKQAYRAYNAWAKGNTAEARLPGLESYTPRQMFWISFGNIWCSKYRPEYLKDLIMTDEHTPNEYRVVGPLSNMQEFAKDFNCPLGSPMNPINKCLIW